MIRKLLAVLVSTATLTGCNVSGVAEKGPFIEGSTVTATAINHDGSLNTGLSSQTTVSDAAGTYRIESGISWNVWLQLEVSGLYFNELSSAVSDSLLTLNATTRTSGTHSKANINLFTHFVTARFQQYATDGFNRHKAYRLAETDLKNLFGLDRKSTRLSITDGQSHRRHDNANLALFSGAFLSRPNHALALDNLAQDFADDGLFNGIGQSDFEAIAQKAAEAGLLTTIRNNLITNGAIDPPAEDDLETLPDWVDTDGQPPIGNNTAPDAVASSEVIDQDGVITIELRAADADGDALTYSISTPPSNGVVTLTGNMATYVPSVNFAGTDSFMFTASDGLSDSLPAEVSITINAPNGNTPPIVFSNSVSVSENSEMGIRIELGAADADGDALIYSLTEANNGSITFLGNAATYTPDENFSGTDSFTFTVSDGQSTSSVATISITVVAADE